MQSSTSSGSIKGALSPDVEKQAEHPIPDHEKPSASEKDQGAAGDITGENGDQWEISPEPILDTEAEGMAGTVNRVLSRISTKSSWNPGPPPDGGRAAWMAVLCGHLVIMNTWGIVNSFGVFQSYYVTTLGRTPSEISWIGSLQIWLIFFLGTLTGRFTDAGFFRPVLVCGTILTAIGIFTTSAATQYWQLLLSQGLCMGLGSGCLFAPAVTTASTYFHKKRSFAIGIVASGSVTGGLVFPAMARQLLPTAGFGWAVRSIGFVQLATLLFANFFMRSRLPPRRTGGLIEWGAFMELEYTCYAIGMFFNFWGVYFAFYYVASFSRTAITPALEYTDSLNLLLIMNGIGIIGRMGPNYLSDRTGPLNMMIPSCLISSIAVMSWIAVHTPSELYGWSVIAAIPLGAVQSLFPAALSSLTTDLRKQGTRMGMTFTIASFSVLTGNPIAGAIITRCDGKYWGAQTFTGVSLLVGMSFIMGARLVRQKRTGGGWILKI